MMFLTESEHIISRHTINSDVSIASALEALNCLSGDVMTLFVVDTDGRVCGSLTDGDVRRGLISGIDINDKVEKVMHRNFKALRPDCNSFDYIRQVKQSNILLLPFLDKYDKIIRIIDLRNTCNLLPLDAVIMAGGRGERLRPLTIDTPKPLLKVGGKAIIDYNLDELARNGIDNIFVTVNYLHNQIEKHISQKQSPATIRCILEPKRLGTLGSAALIDDFRHDDILVMNSDILTTISFENMYARHIESNADLTMAVVPYSVSIPFAIIDIDSADYVKEITEKPSYNYFANAGIYIFKRKHISEITKGEYLDAPDFIKTMIAKGRKISYFPIDGTWVDIGSPDDFRYANELMSRPKEK